MKYSLPRLPYAYDALEPFIDSQTMHLHHEKHHQAYVDKLNTAIGSRIGYDDIPIEDVLKDIRNVPEEIRQAVINHGGGHSNHSIYWNNLAPQGSGEPVGKVVAAINDTFHGFEEFREKFSAQAMSVFGSGWSWLAVNKEGKLEIINRSNQDSPYLDGFEPLLGLDLWEHAYYLKYQNRRVDYVKAWWNVVNWQNVEERFNQA